MDDYTLKWFEIPTSGFKKYNAVLQNARGEVKRVGFGDRRYEQYHDKIGRYAHLDHFDPKRRDNYRKRHAGENAVPLTPGWFAWHYLW